MITDIISKQLQINMHSIHVTSKEGRAARWAGSELTAPQILEEIYLSLYSRYPTEQELATCLPVFEQNDNNNRQVIVEDFVWAMMNTPEFVFKD